MIDLPRQNPADLNKIRWFVMRAYKNERRAEEKLCGLDGLEHFIPKHYAVRVYHGVKSKRLVPVIPSLIFVHACRKQITDFKKNCNFLQFAMFDTSEGMQYMCVPDREMENFMKVATMYENNLLYYNPDEVDLKKGTRVRLHGGALDGIEGTFLRTRGTKTRRLVVQLDGILTVSADIRPELVEVLA